MNNQQIIVPPPESRFFQGVLLNAANVKIVCYLPSSLHICSLSKSSHQLFLLTVAWAPNNVNGNFSAHVSANLHSNISAKPLRSHIQSYRQLLKIPPPPCVPKKKLWFIFLSGILIFSWLRSPHKFQNNRTTTSL